MSIADFLESMEADTDWNDAQRTTIREHEDKHGAAWLGVFNPHGGRGGHPTHAAWDGQFVYNFAADFVVPRFDEELDRLLKERDAAKYTGTRGVAVRVNAIAARIEALGGSLLVWT